MSRRKLTVPLGGRAFHVYLRTYANAVVPVVLTESDLAQVASNLGVAVTDLTPEHLLELLVERGASNTPTLGICCAGGHYASEPTLELGDEWETDRDDSAKSPIEHTLVELDDSEVDRD